MNPIQNAITEDDIASFLVNTPDFFERHASLLANVQLSSGHGSRAISLQERQALLLRDKIKSLEAKVVEMIRHGQENVAIAAKLHRCTRNLLLTTHTHDLPATILAEIMDEFDLPQAAIKLWGLRDDYANEGFATGVSADARAFTASLSTPYCGQNIDFEVATWLPEPAQAQSVALVPLRSAVDQDAFGMLVLASTDRARFQSDMATDFLAQIGQLAGAALTRLLAARA